MVNRVKKMERWTGAISDASKTLLGKNLSRAISDKASGAVTAYPLVPMKKGSGGAIKKKVQGALLHKGEVVLNAKQVKALKAILK